MRKRPPLRFGPQINARAATRAAFFFHFSASRGRDSLSFVSQTVEEQLAELKQEVHGQGKILRRVDRRMRWATYGSIGKWLVYAGLALGAFVWLKPYLEMIASVAQRVEDGAGAVSGFKESWRDAFSDFVDTFRDPAGDGAEQ
jgi:hypothetical protein